MIIVGIIPARWASTRLPGKSLVQICGKPLIQRVVERVKLAKRLDAVLVATDDKRIADVVNALGVKAVMTRPDHPSGTDRIAEALKGVKADIVINIQGDEPLIDPKLIDSLIDAMTIRKVPPRSRLDRCRPVLRTGAPTRLPSLKLRRAGRVGLQYQADEDMDEWDMGTAAAPITNENDLNNPSVVKVVWDENGRALYFSRSVIPFVRDRKPESSERLHWRHIGIYAYRKSFLEKFVKTPPSLLEQAEKLEQLRALHIGGRIVVIQTAEAGIGVDTPDDVKYVEAIIRKTGDNN